MLWINKGKERINAPDFFPVNVADFWMKHLLAASFKFVSYRFNILKIFFLQDMSKLQKQSLTFLECLTHFLWSCMLTLFAGAGAKSLDGTFKGYNYIFASFSLVAFLVRLLLVGFFCFYFFRGWGHIYYMWCFVSLEKWISKHYYYFLYLSFSKCFSAL